MKKKLSELAAELSVTHKNFDLVTVKGRNYYVYRYEGNLNGIENAIVLFSYPEKAFGKLKALRAFLCMYVSLSTNEIMDNYVCRWPIEVFFRQCQDKGAGQLSNPFCTGNPKILVDYVICTLYVCCWNWQSLSF